MWLVILSLAGVLGGANTRVTSLLEHISSLYGVARSKQLYVPFLETVFPCTHVLFVGILMCRSLWQTPFKKSQCACSATLGRILVDADVWQACVPICPKLQIHLASIKIRIAVLIRAISVLTRCWWLWLLSWPLSFFTRSSAPCLLSFRQMAQAKWLAFLYIFDKRMTG